MGRAAWAGRAARGARLAAAVAAAAAMGTGAAAAEAADGPGHCLAGNPFGGPDCVQFRGGDVEEVAAACADGEVSLPGQSGDFVEGACPGYDDEAFAGECDFSTPSGLEVTTVATLGNDAGSTCTSLRTTCEQITGGTWKPSAQCTKSDSAPAAGGSEGVGAEAGEEGFCLSQNTFTGGEDCVQFPPGGDLALAEEACTSGEVSMPGQTGTFARGRCAGYSSDSFAGECVSETDSGQKTALVLELGGEATCGVLSSRVCPYIPGGTWVPSELCTGAAAQGTADRPWWQWWG